MDGSAARPRQQPTVRRRPATLAVVAALALTAATAGVVRVSAATPAASPPGGVPSSAPGSAEPSIRPSYPPSGRVLRVPSQFPTVDLAITASQRGDVILLAPGTYAGAVVPLDRPDITIRGEDRNAVIFDGEDRRATGIRVAADGVAIENLSVHDFTADGIAWTGADGFAGRYLTVWNVGQDGIATRSSADGVIEDSYVSAAAGAGVNVEACQPCATTVRRVTVTLSAIGLTAINAGSDLVVEDSRFQLNGVGILLGSFLIELEPPPQHDALVRGNDVVGSGTVVTPRTSPWAGYHGVGIGIAGGQSNVIEDNDVSGSARYGIAVFTAVDRTTTWNPARNQVTGNTVFDSAIADLAVAGGSGQKNCFDRNVAAISLPAGIADACTSFGTSDPRVEGDLARAPHDLLAAMPEAPDYSEMDPPGPQPAMPIALPALTPTPTGTVGSSGGAPSSVPAPSQLPVAMAGESVILAASVIILALFCVVILLVAFRVVPRRR